LPLTLGKFKKHLLCLGEKKLSRELRIMTMMRTIPSSNQFLVHVYIIVHWCEVITAFGPGGCQVKESWSAVAATPQRCPHRDVCTTPYDEPSGSYGNEDQRREKEGDPGRGAAHFTNSHPS
jgi:hypothetical protein